MFLVTVTVPIIIFRTEGSKLEPKS
jgi:hypothetical protein